MAVEIFRGPDHIAIRLGTFGGGMTRQSDEMASIGESQSRQSIFDAPFVNISGWEKYAPAGNRYCSHFRLSNGGDSLPHGFPRINKIERLIDRRKL